MLDGDISSAFVIDHAKQLSDTIAVINGRWLLEIRRYLYENDVSPSYTSPELERLLRGWWNDIEIACKAKMCGMQAMADHFQKLATEAVRCAPQPVIFDAHAALLKAVDEALDTWAVEWRGREEQNAHNRAMAKLDAEYQAVTGTT